MSNSKANSKFLSISVTTVVLLFVLILAGGVVRSTGSGMGCPDWPKCFGQYVPPTHVSQLPPNYKQDFVDGRHQKNVRFAKTLDALGYHELAKRIREDKSILIPEEFNTAKTWTEYVNRLLGAITGVFLILCAIYSLPYWRSNKWITILSVFNVFLVAFQGWLGSIVVSTNLVAWIVTVHMLLAIAILAITITAYHLAKTANVKVVKENMLLRAIATISVVISLIQITLGTEVREKVDEISGHLLGGYRESWVSQVGDVFHDHRNLSILILVINVLLYALVRKYFSRHSIQQQLMSFSFLIIMVQIVTGIILSYLALPPVAQALHILLASLMFGGQYYLLLNLYRTANLQRREA